MTDRVAIGKLSINSSDNRGLFISQHADPVTSFTKPLEFHSGAAAGLQVFYYAEGSIAAPTSSGSIPSATYIDVTHNWGTSNSHASGDRPLFAVRWSRASDITNNIATQCYPPNTGEYYEQVEECDGGEEEECTQEQSENYEGCSVQHQSNNQIRIYNQNKGYLDDYSRSNGAAIYYAIVVFYEHDWTGGAGL